MRCVLYGRSGGDARWWEQASPSLLPWMGRQATVQIMVMTHTPLLMSKRRINQNP